MRIAEAVATLRLVVYGNGDARQLSGRGHPLVVAIPAAPGLGIEVDRASIERFTIGDRCGEAR